MYQYSIAQWVLFFFFYCFMGWVWECGFTAVKRRIKLKKWKWVNRGFLTGPIIPIYGFAAIFILIAAIPVQDNVYHIFICGALAATLMELITGSVMEYLFHVKYWDYSNLPLNFHGHICFFISVFWGMLSIFMIKVLHRPIENLFMQLSTQLTDIIVFIALAVFGYDFHKSLNEALDMKEMLEKISEFNIVIKRLETRIGMVVPAKSIVSTDKLKLLKINKKDLLSARLEETSKKRLWKLQQLKERLETIDTDEIMNNKDEILQQIEQQIKGVYSRTNKQYFHVISHLKRNPSVISQKYKEAMKEIKDMLEDNFNL